MMFGPEIDPGKALGFRASVAGDANRYRATSHQGSLLAGAYMFVSSPYNNMLFEAPSFMAVSNHAERTDA